MKTKSFSADTIERHWHVVNVAGKPLGRAASQIASILRGKHRPTFTPHADCGDFVVVVNAEKVALTGRKLEQKMYRRHSGYLGGLKELNAAEMLAKHPERLMEYAVRGMLPKNSLGRRMGKKLKVYVGPEHPHEAQRPQPLDLDRIHGA